MQVENRPIAAFERILYLRRFPLFAGLSSSALAAMAESARERFFPKDATLLREGEPIPAIYVVVEGKVLMRRGGRRLGRGGRGAAVGGVGFLARDPEGIEAVAETGTLTLEFDADAVLELLEDHFPILHHMLRDICRQLIALQVRTECDWDPARPAVAPAALPERELDLVDRIFLLRQAAPFTRSSINALAELSRGLAEVRFEPGVTLWKEGESSGGIFLIVGGTVSGSSASRCEPFRVGPGFPLGALEAVGEVPRWYEARTETRVVALHGNVEGMLDVFEDNFDMAMDYLAVMAKGMLSILERTAERDEGSLSRFYGAEAEPAVP